MELIQALEQLSLEVKNQRVNISNQICGDASGSRSYELGPSQLNNSETASGYTDWQYPPAGFYDQLQEFDSSIETLFTQISDLDHHQNQPSRSATRRIHFQLESRHLQGSMETSQEDESDSSSQRSSCAIGSSDERDYINPMVKDLLKRDLATITDTVRKISRILTLGNEIETIHNNISQSLPAPNTSYTLNQSDNQDFNFSHINSLCDSFLTLASSEPHIRNLPTILRYRDYCNKLLLLLSTNSKLLNQQTILNANMGMTNGGGKQGTGNLSEDRRVDDRFEVDDDETDVDDCVLLNCDSVANWTENKLYINHYHQAN